MNWDDDNFEPQLPVTKENEKENMVKKKEVNTTTTKKEPTILISKKLEEQKLVEQSDFENIQDMFGLNEKDSKNPKNEKDFDNLANSIIQKIKTYKENPNYSSFVKKIIRSLIETLKVEDIKEVSSLSQTILKSKQPQQIQTPLPKQQEKKTETTNKKKSNKPSIKVESDLDYKYIDEEEYDDED
jgi:hypothetical protein